MNAACRSNCISSVQLEDGRLGPLLARLLGVSGLVTAPLVQQVKSDSSLVDGDLRSIKGGKELLLALRLGLRFQELASRQSGLYVSDTTLVGRKVGLVP